MDLAAKVSSAAATSSRSVVGRYVLEDELAAGAMASVCLARVHGDTHAQPARTILVKRLHGELLKDGEFVATAAREAQAAARLGHPNLLAPFDILWVERRELLFATEYVPGETLAILFGACFRSGVRMPPPVAVAIVLDVLRGLHAAHEALDGSGQPLGLVHRGVSPQNVLVGVDGVSRVLDFGLATGRARLRTRPPGVTAFFSKGKSAYMSPEQIRRQTVDRRTDVFASSVVLWELLTGERLFRDTGEEEVARQITTHEIPPPSAAQPGVTAALDGVLARALDRKLESRTPTAAALAEEIEAALAPATRAEVSAWVDGTVTERLRERAELVALVENAPLPPPDPTVQLSPLDVAAAEKRAGAEPPPPWARPIPSALSWPPAARRRRRRAALAFSSAGAVLVTLLVLWLWPSSPDPEPARTSAPAADPVSPVKPTPVPSATPSRSAGSATRTGAVRRSAASPPRVRAAAATPQPPDQQASPKKKVTRAPTAKPAPSKTATKTANRAPARAAPKPATAPKAARSKPGCDPPYIVDAQGIRRLKKECLPR